MSPPEKRSATAGRDRGTPQALATALDNVKRTNPLELVRDAHIDALVTAIAVVDKYDSFAVVEFDGQLWFRCPRAHHYIKRNMGPAHVVDHWRWTCDNCRADGTRFELERIVLESSKAIEALQEITVDRLAVMS